MRGCGFNNKDQTNRYEQTYHNETGGVSAYVIIQPHPLLMNLPIIKNITQSGKSECPVIGAVNPAQPWAAMIRTAIIGTGEIIVNQRCHWDQRPSYE